MYLRYSSSVVAPIQRYEQIKNLRNVVQIALNSGKPTNIVYTHIDQKDRIFADRVDKGAIRDKDLKVIKVYCNIAYLPLTSSNKIILDEVVEEPGKLAAHVCRIRACNQFASAKSI